MCNFIFLYFYYRKYNYYYIYINILFFYFTAKTFTEFIPKNNNSFIIQNNPINYSQIQYNQINNYNNLIQQLNDEKNNNKKLEAEIQRLRNELNQNKNLINELNSLKDKIQQLKKENQNLKQNIQNNQMNMAEISKLKQTINDLQIKLQKTDKKRIYMSDIMVINFLTADQSIRAGIPCLPEDTFAEVEEKLYQIYDEFRNTNNIFLFKGNTILRFKKIRENNIKNNDIIQLIKPE